MAATGTLGMRLWLVSVRAMVGGPRNDF